MLPTSWTGEVFIVGTTSCNDLWIGRASRPASEPEKLVTEATIHTPTFFFFQKVCSKKEMMLTFTGNDEAEVLL